MNFSNPPDDALAALLRRSTTIAVVGLSANPRRPSFSTALSMQQRGYHIVPVNPAETVILGETCCASLSLITQRIDIVCVFRRPQDMLPIAQEAVGLAQKLQIQCFWQQLGIDNLEAGHLAASAGLVSVMDRCIKIEHARLL